MSVLRLEISWLAMGRLPAPAYSFPAPSKICSAGGLMTRVLLCLVGVPTAGTHIQTSSTTLVECTVAPRMLSSSAATLLKSLGGARMLTEVTTG
eukprot:COSAG02_NODE_4740_length_5035_cov_4.997771_2_plen_94_part_00